LLCQGAKRVNSEELRNWATVVAASVALLVFLANSFVMVRNRRIENLSRFIASHRQLFQPDGYIAANLTAMEAGQLARDADDDAMEAKFHLMLIEIEHLALLANNSAVPRPTQVYMFGWYATHIQRVVSQHERENMSWELALGYLDALVLDTARYQELTPAERERFWR
jgi:hypothetical protein